MEENNLDEEDFDADGDDFTEETDEDENYDDYGDDRITPMDALHAVGEIAGEYKKAYKGASPKDKRTLLAIFLPLAITFVLGCVGIFLANLGQAMASRTLQIIGFVFMGVGLGGFFLTLVIILIWNKTRR